jgi:hypothetical protein
MEETKKVNCYYREKYNSLQIDEMSIININEIFLNGLKFVNYNESHEQKYLSQISTMKCYEERIDELSKALKALETINNNNAEQYKKLLEEKKEKDKEIFDLSNKANHFENISNFYNRENDRWKKVVYDYSCKFTEFQEEIKNLNEVIEYNGLTISDDEAETIPEIGPAPEIKEVIKQAIIEKNTPEIEIISEKNNEVTEVQSKKLKFNNKVISI